MALVELDVSDVGLVVVVVIVVGFVEESFVVATIASEVAFVVDDDDDDDDNVEADGVAVSSVQIEALSIDFVVEVEVEVEVVVVVVVVVVVFGVVVKLSTTLPSDVLSDDRETIVGIDCCDDKSVSADFFDTYSLLRFKNTKSSSAILEVKVG